MLQRRKLTVVTDSLISGDNDGISLTSEDGQGIGSVRLMFLTVCFDDGESVGVDGDVEIRLAREVDETEAG